ncbi:MAG: hypothetical protein H6689_01025 [Erysipelotrichaceae bacterium]|nr:hypothetical protein [Erysipelotrichaceae bacterium]MCB9500084.1 hypothetical protein [Erysipelotrichaceae bacterium]
MKTINLKIQPRFYNPIIEIDNKVLKYKKGDCGTRIYTFNTESNIANIHIYTLKNELSGKNWFWRNLLFFFISFGNVFNPIYKKKDAYSFDYQCQITLEEQNNIFVILQMQKENGKVLDFKEGSLIDNKSNIYLFDKSYKRKRIINIIIKVINTILFLFLVAYLLMKFVFKII